MIAFKIGYSSYYKSSSLSSSSLSLHDMNDCISSPNSPLKNSKSFKSPLKSTQSVKKSVNSNGNDNGNGNVNINSIACPSNKLVNIREDPILLIIAFVMAPLLHIMGFPLWSYIPSIMIIATYFQVAKEKRVLSKAMSIACDPRLVEQLLKELPGWVNDAEYEKCEFLNKTLEKFWPSLGKAIGKITADIVNPILESVKPSILEQLELTTMEFGTTSPKILGVKFVNSSSHNVRLDLDVRWVSDLVVNLAVGVKNLPLVIILNEVMLNSCISIQLLNPTHEGVIPFEVVSISLIGNPTLNFSLKIANLDVLNIGILDFNIDSLIKGIIKDIVADLLVAPNKILVPMYAFEDEKLSKIYNPSPQGLLILNIEKATNIIAGDFWGTSDAYITIKSASGLLNTQIKYATLNPVWNETLEILIKDAEAEVLNVELYDHDIVGVDKLIGKAIIPLRSCDNGDMVITLKEANSDRPAGTLYLNGTYVPFVASDDNDDNQELFDANTDYLDNDYNDDHKHDSHKYNNIKTPVSIRSSIGDSFSFDSWSANNESIIEGGITIGLLEISKMKCKNIKVDLNKGINTNSTTNTNTYTNLDKGFVMRRAKKLTPYLTIAIKNSNTGVTTFSKATRPAQKGFVNPTFDESFPIIIRDPLNDVLEISVLSGRKNAIMQDEFFLGKVNIPINELSHSLGESNVVIEREYLLYDGIYEKEQRFFSCKLSWRIAKTKL